MTAFFVSVETHVAEKSECRVECKVPPDDGVETFQTLGVRPFFGVAVRGNNSVRFEKLERSKTNHTSSESCENKTAECSNEKCKAPEF